MSAVTWLNKFHCLCWCYGFGETERTTEKMSIKTDPEYVSEVFPLVQIHKHNKRYISPVITVSTKHGKLVHKLQLYVIFHFLLQIFKSFVVWLKRDHAHESYKIKIKNNVSDFITGYFPSIVLGRKHTYKIQIKCKYKQKL